MPSRRPEPGNEQDVQRTGQRVPGGLALSADGKTLWVANVWGHTVARFDAETGKLLGETRIGDDTYPYGLALDEEAGTGSTSASGARPVVAVLDAETGEVVGRWPTEEHPNEMLLARDGEILYVANANRNTVTVFDTEAGRALETIGTAIAPDAPAGSHPERPGPDARRDDPVRRERQHEQPRGGQRRGAGREPADGVRPGRLVSDLRPARRPTARRST